MRRELVQRAQAGDHAAFELLARDALDRLYGTARLILLEPDLAREAARDTLITAWRDLRRLPDPNELTPWLQGIVVRTTRRTGASEIRRTPDADLSRASFEALTRDERTILALVYFAELTVPDTSVALDVTPEAAGARLHDAFEALRTALGLDETAEEKVDLEWRLRSWLAREAAPPDLTAVAETVAAATRGTAQRRRPLVAPRGHGADRAGARRRGRRLGVALVTVLALTVAVAGGLLVSRLVGPRIDGTGPEQASARGGLFRATGDLSNLAGTLEQPSLAVLNDGRVLVVGVGEVLLGGVVFDPVTGRYGEPIRDGVLRLGSTATTLQSSLVLLTGGTFGGGDVPAATTVLFDPFSETFAPTTPMTVARAGHTATLLDDGRVLIAGGRHRGERSNSRMETEDSAEIYDPATGTFTATGTMTRTRAGHTATKLPDGRVLIAGGFTTPLYGSRVAQAQAEIFDPATNTFHATGEMTTPRGDHSATMLADGRVLFVGGTDRFDSDGVALHAIADAEVFDPKAGTFTAVGSLVTERTGHSATRLADGRIFVAGGHNDIGDPLSTEIFDPTRATFSPGPFAAAPHHATLAPLLSDGNVLRLGVGQGASEVFDPLATGDAAAASAAAAARPFTPVATTGMRFRPLLVELDNGRILVIGGAGEDESVNRSSEIFDPSTGSMTQAGESLHQLSDPLATHLPDGRLFITGMAFNGEGVAEIFDPATETFGRVPDSVTDVLRTLHPVPTVGFSDGHLVLSDGYSVIQTYDAVAGTLGPTIQVCEYPRVAVVLDASHLLIGCGTDFDALIVNLATATPEPTDLRFDHVLALDGRRIALTTTTYEYLVDRARAFDRITAIYDLTDGSVTRPPDTAVVGGTVVAAGDRLIGFGGGDGDPSDAAVAVDTSAWAPTDLGRLLAPRFNASAIVLRDGRVLIVGGARQSPDRSVPLPPGAELFDPSRVQ